jgi:hypothetical protein
MQEKDKTANQIEGIDPVFYFKTFIGLGKNILSSLGTKRKVTVMPDSE